MRNMTKLWANREDFGTPVKVRRRGYVKAQRHRSRVVEPRVKQTFCDVCPVPAWERCDRSHGGCAHADDETDQLGIVMEALKHQ